MIHFSMKTKAFARCLSIMTFVALSLTNVAQAQNAPAEQTSAVVTRTADQGSSANVRLSKNLFRTETVQVPYVERVPYQETETYIEEVPYTVRVPYTDYETDYRDEYKCETVTRYRDEYKCENVTRYRDEYRCENVTRYRQECRNEQRCYLVPGEPGQCRDVEECGTNAQGQPICKVRRVCDPGSGSQQRCDNERVCENVPYTDRECRNERVPYYEQECRTDRVPYYDQECRTVSVPYRREVTKYRDETRYRKETRTRTVTKYRDEQRCCRPEERQVFDRQLAFQVQLSFPQQAVLVAGEVERIVVSLAGTQPGSVSIDARQAIFGYQVLSQSASGEVINVQLGLAPKFDLSNAGESSIQSLRAKFSLDLRKFVVTVQDTIADSSVAGRLQSTATIAIQDLATGALIEEQPVAQLANGQKGIVVNAFSDSQSKFQIVLKVQRSGTLVSGGAIRFAKVQNYDRKLVSQEDMSALADAKKVSLAVANAAAAVATMSLVDTTEDFADVQTALSITVYELKGDARTTVVDNFKMSREQLKANNETIDLKQLLGAKASQLIRAGKQFRFHITLTRTGEAGSVLAKPVQFVLKSNITIK